MVLPAIGRIGVFAPHIVGSEILPTGIRHGADAAFALYRTAEAPMAEAFAGARRATLFGPTVCQIVDSAGHLFYGTSGMPISHRLRALWNVPNHALSGHVTELTDRLCDASPTIVYEAADCLEYIAGRYASLITPVVLDRLLAVAFGPRPSTFTATHAKAFAAIIRFINALPARVTAAEADAERFHRTVFISIADFIAPYLPPFRRHFRAADNYAPPVVPDAIPMEVAMVGALLISPYPTFSTLGLEILRILFHQDEPVLCVALFDALATCCDAHNSHAYPVLSEAILLALDVGLTSALGIKNPLPAERFQALMEHLIANRPDAPVPLDERYLAQLIQKGLPHPDPTVRSIAARMIVTIGIDTPGHVPETICPTLISILFDDDLPAETIYDNAQLLGRLLRVAPFRALLPAVWKRLDCVEMTFADGGNSASSTAGFMRGYVHRLPERAGYLTVDDARLPFAVDTLPDLLQRMRVNEAPIYRGRSACYSLPDGERTLVVKYAHSNQSGHALGRELKWLDRLAAADISLRSFLPTPVRDSSDRPVLWRDGERTAIAFVAHRSYYRYPNDDGVTDVEFFEGIADAMHDIFSLARYGVYHTAPIAAFHNGEPGALHRPNGDHGRYTIFPDAAFDWDTRGGLGRLDDWPKALRFPNIGVFGMRDCEELATLSEIITDGERWAPQLRSLGDKLSNDMFYEMCLLGMAPFAAALLVGERIARQADPAWLRTLITRADRPDPPLERYAKWLLHFFAEAYAGRHGFHVHHAKAVLEARADWVRLARQLAFFMTPTYVPFVRQGQPAHQFPEAAIYGRSVLTQMAMGKYRPGTFDHERGFIGPSGDPTQLALGPVNGPFPITELEKALFALFW